MKAYSLFFVICYFCRYTSFEIKPELKKNIIKFDYGINYKYEWMLAHSFDRFYVVTKFILPTAEDLKFSTLNFNKDGEYMWETKEEQTEEAKQHISHLITYCTKIGPHIYFYKQHIKSLNETVHHILKK